MAMDLKDVNLTINKDHEDENSQQRQSKKIDHEFYFAKMNKLFIDPTLEARLELAKKSKHRIVEKRENYRATYIKPLEENLKLATLETRRIQIPDLYPSTTMSKISGYKRCIEGYRATLERFWPESINEDIEKGADADTELVEIREKTRRLSRQIRNSTLSVVEEKRIVKELENLHRREEKCESEIREADAKTPRSSIMYYTSGESKYDLRRKIRDYMKKVSDLKQPQNNSMRLRYERLQKRIGDVEKEIAHHEAKCLTMEHEEHKADERISQIELSMQEQSFLYGKNRAMLKKARTLASEKDSATLDKLSHKQVEAFMSKWASDETFRANYTRSIQLSLANRGLSSDGRMEDPSE